MAQAIGQNLPPPQTPFVNQGSLTISNDGYQFLLSLLLAAANAANSVAPGLTATGTTQANALQLSADWNEVTAVPFGAGVLLEALGIGEKQKVFNADPNNALAVYPPPGMLINALGVDLAFSLAPKTSAEFDFLSSEQIRT